MSDFDTQRIGEIMELEQQVKALRDEVQRYKTIAERWEPRVAAEVNPTARLGKVSLTFGGKTISATMSFDYLEKMDLTTATTSCVETLCSSLVIDRLRGVVQPEVQKLMDNVTIVMGAGKW